MNKHPHKHHDKHQQKPNSPKPGLHKDWRTWAVVLAMLGAMLMYILSGDESIQPGGGEGPSVPAAP